MGARVVEHIYCMPKEVEEKPEFNIEQLFGSKTRVRLLRLMLDDPERAYYVRELTRRIDAQLNSVRRELKNLIDIGILLESEGNILPEEERGKPKKNDKKKYYKANANFSFFPELRSIMKKSAILSNKSFVHDLEAKGKLDLLLLTGRFIDREDIPSDVLVVGTLKPEALQESVAAFEAEIGREINYTYMPRDEFYYRREVSDRFLDSLLVVDRVVLVNNTDLELWSCTLMDKTLTN